ncbi:hypothetical protein JHK87_052399 [Glycine soja]|nr:hypothetical protein JHK87_052399 [Glycine soja]
MRDKQFATLEQIQCLLVFSEVAYLTWQDWLPLDYTITCPWMLCNATYARLDLYLPANIGEPKPVLIFVTGGAWIIGYKAWGSLLGLQLAERGIIVACIDYRYLVSVQAVQD